MWRSMRLRLSPLTSRKEQPAAIQPGGPRSRACRRGAPCAGRAADAASWPGRAIAALGQDPCVKPVSEREIAARSIGSGWSSKLRPLDGRRAASPRPPAETADCSAWLVGPVRAAVALLRPPVSPVLRLLARPGATQRPRRRGVNALVPVVPANAIARGRCLPHHLLDDAHPRPPLGRLRLDPDAIPDLQLHGFTSDSPHRVIPPTDAYRTAAETTAILQGSSGAFLEEERPRRRPANEGAPRSAGAREFCAASGAARLAGAGVRESAVRSTTSNFSTLSWAASCEPHSEAALASVSAKRTGDLPGLLLLQRFDPARLRVRASRRSRPGSTSLVGTDLTQNIRQIHPRG